MTRRTSSHPMIRSVTFTPAATATPDMVDLARNVAAFDDSLLRNADLNVLRATLREFREQARAIIDQIEGRAP